MKFLDKYNAYKQKYLINEGTIKSLIPLIQKNIFDNEYGVDNYDELTDEQKQELPFLIEAMSTEIENKVNSITSNAQYKSWIYDILKNQDQNIFEDYNDIKWTINTFEKLCKSLKYNSDQKNIQNYKSFQQLHEFVFNSVNKDTKYDKVQFPLLYSNDLYNLYKIGYIEKEKFQRIYGKGGFKTAWCVATDDDDYFENYLEGDDDYYILWLTKDNKPFALLHYNSNQFKDVHDRSIKEEDNQYVIDGLIKTGFLDDKRDGDLTKFTFPIFKYQIKDKENKDQLMQDYICRLYGVIYNKETNKYDAVEFFHNSGDSNIEILKDLVDDQGHLKIEFGTGFNNTIFSAENIGLTSLKGFPTHLTSLLVRSNKLKSLKDNPIKSMSRTLDLSDNQIESLEGLQHLTIANLFIGSNYLTSLQYSPKVRNAFRARGNSLRTLEGLPNEQINILDVRDNDLVSLKGCPVHINTLLLEWNKLKSIQYCPKSAVVINFSYNEITDNYEQLDQYFGNGYELIKLGSNPNSDSYTTKEVNNLKRRHHIEKFELDSF